MAVSVRTQAVGLPWAIPNPRSPLPLERGMNSQFKTQIQAFHRVRVRNTEKEGEDGEGHEMLRFGAVLSELGALKDEVISLSA